MRAVLMRANAAMGANYSLHDLRHTAALRMAADPAFALVDVQAILRHAKITTTQAYLVPRLDDLVAKVAGHTPGPGRPRGWTWPRDMTRLRSASQAGQARGRHGPGEKGPRQAAAGLIGAHVPSAAGQSKSWPGSGSARVLQPCGCPGARYWAAIGTSPGAGDWRAGAVSAA
jgi:hypothetical protein